VVNAGGRRAREIRRRSLNFLLNIFFRISRDVIHRKLVKIVRSGGAVI
jgi:hypothetical protein